MCNPLRNLKSVSLLALFLLPTILQAEAVKDYPAVSITPRVWVIEGPLGFPTVENQGFINNPAFIETSTGIVVIDPGSSVQAGRMVLKQIRKVSNKPVTHVLNTHVHGDHWLGNQAVVEAFPEAQAIAHPLMIDRAREHAAAEWIRIMMELTAGYTQGTRAVIPETSMTNGDVLETGGVHFKIHAPEAAHSGTDIMIEVVEERVLFLGDNVTHKRIAGLDDASFRGNIEACKVALATDADKFVPGHGPVGGREIVEDYQHYLSEIYRLASTYYEEGLEDYEMKPLIIKELSGYSDWVNFQDQVGRHISLAILEYENTF